MVAGGECADPCGARGTGVRAHPLRVSVPHDRLADIDHLAWRDLGCCDHCDVAAAAGCLAAAVVGLADLSGLLPPAVPRSRRKAAKSYTIAVGDAAAGARRVVCVRLWREPCQARAGEPDR